MELKPLVSIGMPLYNSEDRIEKVLKFFLSQSYKNIEIIISDNLSTDKTSKIIKNNFLQNHRIKFFQQKINIGATRNFNFVLDKSNGKYFMWASYDDEWNSDYIKNGVEKLEKDEGIVTITGVTKIYDKNKILRIQYSEDYNLNGNKYERLKNFLRYNYGDHLIYGIHRLSIVKKIKFSTKFFSPEIYFLFNILCFGKIIGSENLQFNKYEDFKYSRKQNKYIKGGNRIRQAKHYKLKENILTRHGMMIAVIFKIVSSFNLLTSFLLLVQILLFKNPVLRLIKIYPKNSKNMKEFK